MSDKPSTLEIVRARLKDGRSIADSDVHHLVAQIDYLRGSLEEVIFVIEDYLNYQHDGDPWTEDARAMGEMEINEFGRDGRLKALKDLLV